MMRKALPPLPDLGSGAAVRQQPPQPVETGREASTGAQRHALPALPNLDCQGQSLAFSPPLQLADSAEARAGRLGLAESTLQPASKIRRRTSAAKRPDAQPAHQEGEKCCRPGRQPAPLLPSEKIDAFFQDVWERGGRRPVFLELFCGCASFVTELQRLGSLA